MTRSKIRCPTCKKKMKYLFENEYIAKMSSRGKRMMQYNGIKRALYCNVCDEIYKIVIEKIIQNIEDKNQTIKNKIFEENKVVKNV